MTVATETYTPAAPIWCAGCGHYAVLNALLAGLGSLEVAPHEAVVLAGIGCSGTIQNYVGAYGYHALHGRVLPAATGVALANPRLTVVAAGGDGDCYAIGVGHLVHAFRRNLPLTYIVMTNERYGLTKGQLSPVARGGQLDGALLGLGIPGTTFVARGYSGRYEQLARLTRAALEHARGGHGFAFLEVISPCVTYEDAYPRWEQALVDVDGVYDPADRAAAFGAATSLAAEDRLPVGLLYRDAGHGRAEAPVPADAPLDPVSLRERWEAILDGYAV